MKLTLEEANRLMDKNNGTLDLRGTNITSLPEGLTVDGSLDLGGTSITSLPEGLAVGGSLSLCGTPITSLPEGLTVGGSLDLSCTPIASLPENLSVGGSLYLSGTGITSIPKSLTVGGSLNLSGTNIASLPEGLTVGGLLDLHGTNIASLPKGLTVGGSLNLSGSGITSLPENLTVGGSLDLSGTGVTSLPEGLTVSGWLDLYDTGITSLPENLAVGDKLYLDLGISEKNVHRLQNDDYVPGRYIYADGILTHVKAEKHVGKYTVYIGKIKDRNVISDGKRYAHCEKIRNGIADLIFKAASDRGAGQYRNLSLDSELLLDEAKAMYRVITGACRQGTEAFVASLKDKLKGKYTVREMLELTEGQYGHDKFAVFFGR